MQLLSRKSVNLAQYLTRNVQPLCVRGITYNSVQVHYLGLGEGRSLAYHSIPGHKSPSVLMVPGLHPYTHMRGHKAQTLLRFCDRNGYPCTVYDHECCGLSSGRSDMKKLLFSHWVEDAVAAAEQLTEGPLVLLGASLGGWLAVRAAQKLPPSRLHSLLLITPALNYVWPYYNRYRATLPKEVRGRLDVGDPHVISHEYGDSILMKEFALDSRAWEVDLNAESLGVSCPVRIIHGMEDKLVPLEDSVKLARCLESEDVDIILRKSGDHQMEQPTDLELALVTLDRLLKDNPVH